jgi:hypothetical protein
LNEVIPSPHLLARRNQLKSFRDQITVRQGDLLNMPNVKRLFNAAMLLSQDSVRERADVADFMGRTRRRSFLDPQDRKHVHRIGKVK